MLAIFIFGFTETDLSLARTDVLYQYEVLGPANLTKIPRDLVNTVCLYEDGVDEEGHRLSIIASDSEKKCPHQSSSSTVLNEK